jgi:uncharacterized protein YbjT (DUF2867 family)
VITLLDRGYKVRAATRSVKKQRPFQQHLEDRYGKDVVEFVEFTDYLDPASWDAILKSMYPRVQCTAQDPDYRQTSVA